MLKKFNALSIGDKWAVGVFAAGNLILLFVMVTQLNWFYLDAPAYVLSGQYTGWNWMAVFKGAFSAGRAYPLGWMTAMLTSFLFGNHPAWHFLWRYIGFALGVTGLYLIVRRYLTTVTQRIVILLGMYLATPLAEEVFTVGKQETLFTLAAALTFAFLLGILEAYDSGKKPKLEPLQWSAVCVLFIIAILSKETSMILAIPAVLLLIYSFLYRRDLRRAAVLFLAMFLLAETITKIIAHAMSSGDNQYTAGGTSLSNLAENLRIYLFQCPDLYFFGILGFLCCLRLWLKNRKDFKLFFLLCCNITGWGYLCGMCLWHWAFVYYLYPIAFFFSVSNVGALLYDWKKRGTGKKKKGSALPNVVLACVVCVAAYQVVYGYDAASAQIDSDNAYTQMIEGVCANVPDKHRLLMENYAYYEEQPIETARLFTYGYHKDVTVLGMHQYLTQESNETPERFALYGTDLKTWKEKKAEATPQVGDYIALWTGYRDDHSHLRTVDPMPSCTDSQLLQLGYGLEVVDATRVERRTPAFTNTGFHLNTWFSGYKLYKVTSIPKTQNVK